MGFPGGSDGKESSCNMRDLDSIPGLERSPGGRNDNPLQHSCLENPHGQRSLVGYSPQGLKESDMTATKQRTQNKRVDCDSFPAEFPVTCRVDGAW